MKHKPPHFSATASQHGSTPAPGLSSRLENQRCIHTGLSVWNPGCPHSQSSPTTEK